jgi:hypothetical protein
MIFRLLNIYNKKSMDKLIIVSPFLDAHACMHICKNDGKGNTQMCKLLQPKSIDKVFSKPPLMCVYIYIYIYTYQNGFLKPPVKCTKGKFGTAADKVIIV